MVVPGLSRASPRPLGEAIYHCVRRWALRGRRRKWDGMDKSSTMRSLERAIDVLEVLDVDDLASVGEEGLELGGRRC